MHEMLRKRGTLSTSVLLILFGALQLQAFPPSESETLFKSKVFPNGLEVIVIPDGTVPLVTIDIVVRNGAFTEPDEFAGLSHLYEHMFFKANAMYPSQELYMDRVRELGITYNGYTTDELVNYFFTLPVAKLDEGMAFMAAAITTPKFTQEELVRERAVVLGEFDRNEAQPSFVLRYALDSAMWMPYVSRKQPLGQRNVINNATVAQMEMIRDRFYVPNNSALIVSGDVDPELVFELAERYLSDWKKGEEPFPTYDPPKFPMLRSQLVVRPAAVPNPLLRMGWHGPSLGEDDPDPYVADILFTIVNQPTSRLSGLLIDSGLVTNFYLGYQTAGNTGAISLYATVVDPANVKVVTDIVKNELRAIAAGGYFSNEDLVIAKQIMFDARIFQRENIYNFTIRTVPFWWSVGGSIDAYNQYVPRLNKVTMPQLSSFVSDYMVGQPFVLGVGADEASLPTVTLSEADLSW